MAYTESNLVNPMSAFDYTLMLKIKITGESMTGPDHYRAAERFLEEAKSGNDSSSRAAWCLELAKLHVALAQVAATALNSDGREWMEVAGHKFSGTSPASHVQGQQDLRAQEAL
jgi:hypothetical protein